MKVFNTNKSINIVDENNIAVGYDTSQSCCEEADYFFSESFPYIAMSPVPELDSYIFVPDMFEECSKKDFVELTFDDGGAVAFTLVDKLGVGPKLYLILYNSHNGHYHHGFTVKLSGTNIGGGVL
jgi:hypothetical protein